MTRTISPGFKAPADMRGDDIYVTITRQSELNVIIKADSAVEFQYDGQPHKHIGEYLHHNGVAKTQYDGLVDKLVNENDGTVDSSRLILEGVRAYDVLTAIETQLKLITDL